MGDVRQATEAELLLQAIQLLGWSWHAGVSHMTLHLAVKHPAGDC